MSNASVFRKYEDATRHYYGSDTDPLKLIPVVKSPEVAHGIALQVNRHLQAISEEDFTQNALRAQSVNRLSHGETDLAVLKERALFYALNMVVVNAELTHARLAPEDFGEDAATSLAYEMSNKYITLPPVNPKDLRQ